MHISITTMDEELRRKMEPRTSSSKMRFRTIEALSKAGIPVNVMMAPIIPGLNSDEVFQIAEASKNAGAHSLSYTMVRLNGAIALVFEDWIQKVFPLKASRVMNLISNAQGGSVSNYNIGERMKGKGHFAHTIKQQVNLAKKKFALDNKMPPFNLNSYKAKANGQLNLF